MRLNPRYLFMIVPYFMRAPMKIKIVIGVAALAFFGWTQLGKNKTQRPAMDSQPPVAVERQQP